MWKDLFISIGIVAGICVILGVALGKIKGKPVIKDKIIKSKISYMD